MNGYRKCGIYEILFSLKNDEIMWFAEKWMGLEIIMFSERSQIQKINITCFFSDAESKFLKTWKYKEDYLKRGRGPVGEQGGRERVIGGEYDQKTFYTRMKMS
jgi:hypothetical protein